MFFKNIFLFLFLLSTNTINAQGNNLPTKLLLIPSVSGLHIAVNRYSTALSFGAVGDGVTDDTYALIRAFSSGQNLDLEGRKYLIDVSKPGLILGLKPSNNTIIEGNGAEIILKPNKLMAYGMITLENRKNVRIYNLKLTGDVKNHYGSEGEWGMGFWMQGSKNCELHHVEANEMWGDGFYVGNYAKETSEGGGIFNSSARANRRDGLTVTSCKNFTVKNSNFTETGIIKSIYPRFGVCIEPEPHSYSTIDNLKLINIRTEHNFGGGMRVMSPYLGSSTHSNAKCHIYIEKFVSKHDGNKKIWGGTGLRLADYFYENTYDGLIIIKEFNVIDLIGEVPYRWVINSKSIISIYATDLRVDGVPGYAYIPDIPASSAACAIASSPNNNNLLITLYFIK